MFVPAESASLTRTASAPCAEVPITDFTTVAVAVAAVPKNVSVSVARTTPRADWISITETPDDPSANTATSLSPRTVIARPRASAVPPPEVAAYVVVSAPEPRRPGPDLTSAF